MQSAHRVGRTGTTVSVLATLFGASVALVGCPDTTDSSSGQTSSGANASSSGTGASGSSSSSSSGATSSSSGNGSSSSGTSNGGTDAGADTAPPLPDKDRPAGTVCDAPAQCASLVCDFGKCVDPAPSDGVKNGDETDIDCGGSKATPCGPSKGCAVAKDCASLVCASNVCAAPSPTDTVKNGTETDVDCGGDGVAVPRCADTKTCNQASDCVSLVCDPVAKTCTAPTDTDTVKNGTETDVDCGGGVAKKCAVGKVCAQGNRDCTSLVCGGNVCVAASANDNVKNGNETDIDCGGPDAGTPRCATSKACLVGTDCLNKVCNAGTKTCSAPTGTDGVKNGDESDVDCGGVQTGAPKCAATKSCNAHTDCLSDGCNAAGKCAVGRSCTQVNGGETCGTREVGQAGTQHESCCVALQVPGLASKLDKYKVTAGRMRAMVTREGGNIKAWYANNKNSLSQAARDQIEPYKDFLPDTLNGFPMGANYQLGATIYLPTRPSSSQGCYVGNAQNVANGSHTYWAGNLEGEDLGFDQSFRDRLPLNCVPYPLMAAFCAWDGGRLETYAEHLAAYGASTYPWGNAPEGGGGFGATPIGPATSGFTNNLCPACSRTHLNWRNGYQFPAGGNAAKPWDYAYWMSPPGRFPLDSGVNGHKDMAGVMMELTATLNGTETMLDRNGVSVTQPRVRWSKNGSWEGHQVNAGYSFAIMTKYGKVGGRCARD